MNQKIYFKIKSNYVFDISKEKKSHLNELLIDLKPWLIN